MKRVFLLAAVMLLSVGVIAQVYTYRFSGNISLINENENGVLPVTTGDPFSGWFSFQDVPDQNSDPRRGEYNQNASIFLTLPNLAFNFENQPAYILIDDNFGGTAFYDHFIFNCQNYWYQGDYEFRNFSINLNDYTDNTALNSTDLPPVLIPDAFDESNIILHGWSVTTDDFFNVYGHITEITLIPEPATMLLMLAGGFCLRRKR